MHIAIWVQQTLSLLKTLLLNREFLCGFQALTVGFSSVMGPGSANLTLIAPSSLYFLGFFSSTVSGEGMIGAGGGGGGGSALCKLRLINLRLR